MTVELITKDVSSGIEIIIKAQTEEEAVAAAQNYCSRYPSQGYETRFRHPSLDGDVWTIHGWRARSC